MLILGLALLAVYLAAGCAIAVYGLTTRPQQFEKYTAVQLVVGANVFAVLWPFVVLIVFVTNLAKQHQQQPKGATNNDNKQ